MLVQLLKLDSDVRMCAAGLLANLAKNSDNAAVTIASADAIPAGAATGAWKWTWCAVERSRSFNVYCFCRPGERSHYRCCRRHPSTGAASQAWISRQYKICRSRRTGRHQRGHCREPCRWRSWALTTHLSCRPPSPHLWGAAHLPRSWTELNRVNGLLLEGGTAALSIAHVGRQGRPAFNYPCGGGHSSPHPWHEYERERALQ
jgi:hypothetical protein